MVAFSLSNDVGTWPSWESVLVASCLSTFFYYKNKYRCINKWATLLVPKETLVLYVKHLAISIFFCASLEKTCQTERNIILTSTDFIICEMFIVLEDDFVEIRFKAIITWTWRIKIKTLDYLQTNKILTLFDGRRLYFRIFDGWQLLVNILLTSFKFQCIFIARDDSLANSMINIAVVLKNWFTFYYCFFILIQIQY